MVLAIYTAGNVSRILSRVPQSGKRTVPKTRPGFSLSSRRSTVVLQSSTAKQRGHHFRVDVSKKARRLRRWGYPHTAPWCPCGITAHHEETASHYYFSSIRRKTRERKRIVSAFFDVLLGVPRVLLAAALSMFGGTCRTGSVTSAYRGGHNGIALWSLFRRPAGPK